VSKAARQYTRDLYECPNGQIITRSEKLICMILADYHQDTGRPTFPSEETLATDAMVCVRTIQRCMDSLENKGVISRSYPAGRGRGKTCFYAFPALAQIPEERRQNDTLPTPAKNAGKATEGRHKGDIGDIAYKEERERKQRNANTPKPPQAGATGFEKSSSVGADVPKGDPLAGAVAQVMQNCGFSERRMARVIRAQLAIEADKGAFAGTAALEMVAAWREHITHPLIKWRFKPRDFFGSGHWRNSTGWMWDSDAINRQGAASIGLHRPDARHGMYH